MIRKTRIHFIILTLLLSVFTIQPAFGKKKVVLLPFDGKVNKKGTKKIRNFIKNLLKGNYEYVTKKTIKEGMEKNINFREITNLQIKDICSKFEITSFIGGKMVKKGRKYYFTILVYTWETGDTSLSKEFKLRRRIPRQKFIEKVALETLQGIESLKEFKAPEPEEEKPEINQIQEEEKPEIKVPIVKKKKKVVPKAILPKLRAGLAFGFFTRNLDFDPASEPYFKTSSLSFAPILNLEAYPMAFVNPKGVVANIGVMLNSFYMPAFKTYASDNKNEKIDTFILDFGIDLLYRHQLSKELVLIGKVGYQNRQWTFAQNDILDTPGVSYSMFDLGVLARFNVAKIAVVEGGLSFLLPLDAGDIVSGDFYGQASVYGLKFNFLFGYKIIDNVEITAQFDYNRISFSFSGDGKRTANGAVDQYLSFAVGGRYVF